MAEDIYVAWNRAAGNEDKDREELEAGMKLDKEDKKRKLIDQAVSSIQKRMQGARKAAGDAAGPPKAPQ